VPLVFVPRSGRYGAGGKTWRHISQSGRVPPDRRLAFAPNGHEPRLLVAREPRWAEVTLHLEEPGSGDVIAPGVEIEEAAREDLSAE
jgi:hypothetical protein